MRTLLFCLVTFCGLYSSAALAKLNVFACEPDWAALAQEIGGDLVSISSATLGTQDPHHIQARPSLIAKTRKADLLICSGAELEVGWLPLLLRKTGNPAIQPGAAGHFMATNFVSLQGQPDKLDRSEGDIHAAGNPHVQLSPYRISEVALALKQRLSEIDAGNRQEYEQRYSDFSERWETAIKNWEAQAQAIKGKNIIVHHDSWLYLADWLSLNIIAKLEPKPGIPPTTEHLSQLVKQADPESTLMIIYAPYKDPRAANWLADKTGIPASKLPTSVGGVENTETLFALYDHIIQRLVEAVE